MNAVSSRLLRFVLNGWILLCLPALLLAQAPIITAQPQSVTVIAGQPATFRVFASGTDTATYQWRRGGFPVAGATNTTYTLSNARRADAGVVDVVVTNSGGSVTSNPALLSVAPTAYPGQMAIDSTYNPDPITLSARVYASLPLPDGKWLVGGDFSRWDNTPVRSVARLNADLTLDTTYTPPLINGLVHALARATDGSIYVGGDFTAVDGHLRPGLARLTAAHTLDLSWQPLDTVPLSQVSALAVQPDGKLLVARMSWTSGAIFGPNVLRRLNLDGTLDATFNVNVALIGTLRLYSVIVEPAGSIVFAGGFTSVDGSSRGGLARVSSTGTLDPTFGGSAGANNVVFTLTRLDDGRYLAGGQFTQIGGVLRNRLAILSAAGAIDPGFVPASSGTTNGNVYGASVLSDGCVVAGGNFTSFAGLSTFGLIRLTGTGAIDRTYTANGVAPTAFGYGSSQVGRNLSVYTLPGDAVALFGVFQILLNERRVGVAVVNHDGTVAATPAPLVYHPAYLSIPPFLERDGQLTLFGSIDIAAGIAGIGQTVRITDTGSLDPTFPGGVGFTLNGLSTFGIYRAVRQADGKYVAIGDFVAYNGTPATRLVRLNADGTIDPTFNAGGGPNNYLVQLLALAGGKTLIFGIPNGFTYDGVGASWLLRLNVDGSRDSSFDPGTGFRSTSPASMIEYPDGKLYAGGSFTSYRGVTVPGLVRINRDGSVDPAFNPGTGPGGGSVGGITLLRDGRLLLSGSFTSYNGHPANRLAIIFPSGALDTRFSAGAAVDGTVGRVIAQEDDRVIVIGGFSRGPGIRLTATGALDDSFALLGITGTPNGDPWTISPLMADDGSLYVSTVVSVNYGYAPTLQRFRGSEDTTPPVIAPPTDMTEEATSAAGAVATFTATATDDVDGPVPVFANPASGTTFPIDTTIVGLAASDKAGNTASATFKVTVQDTTPPAITSVTPSAATLWPPNKKMVAVTLTASVADAVGVASLKIISVTTNEPKADTQWQITGPLTLNLLADRLGTGTGRIYTITVEARDAAGNASTKITTVTVPHDQGK